MTPERLAEIEAVWAKATPGPWETRRSLPYSDSLTIFRGRFNDNQTLVRWPRSDDQGDADATAVAAAPAHIAELLAHIRELNGELGAAELSPNQAEQIATWERGLAQYSHRSDSSGYAGRMGEEVLGALRRARLANAVLVIAYRRSIEKRLEMEAE